MDKLIVQTGKLKPEYRKRKRLWDLFFRRFFRGFSSIWKKHALIHYPLTIDIEIGTMKYHYFRYGFKHTRDRIMKYNFIMVDRLDSKEETLNPEDFYVQELLTDEQQVKAQLDKELAELCLN